MIKTQSKRFINVKFLNPNSKPKYQLTNNNMVYFIINTKQVLYQLFISIINISIIIISINLFIQS